jgi:lipoyl(octanoyl) transferase
MRVVDLGRMRYVPAWEVQKDVAEDVMAGGEDTLLFVEHEPVLTLGASFHVQNLLLSRAEYERRGIEVVRTDRGGDVTFHGPGQLVIYPVFDLKRHGQDLHRWMRELEESVIQALAAFSVAGARFPPHTGVWVGGGAEQRLKIAAIGVKVKRWVSIHGIALNCDNDLGEFGLIVPCGIVGYGVTSLSLATGKHVSPSEAKRPVEDAFAAVFARSSVSS